MRFAMPRRVDYSAIAGTYDRRYEDQAFDGVERALRGFLGDRPGAVLEVGCGTGHWLQIATRMASWVVGADAALAMLQRADHGARAALACARAESLPWKHGTLDRVFCINAYHHFENRIEFVREAHRVLHLQGGLMIVGLDPHTRLDRWWIYDWFPQAQAADLERYPSTQTIRAQMLAAGFHDIQVREVQHLPVGRAATEVLAGGMADRGYTSQLTLLSAEEYAQGIDRLRRAVEATAATGEELILSADLRLYGVTGWV